jgi:hypothetical protein
MRIPGKIGTWDGMIAMERCRWTSMAFFGFGLMVWWVLQQPSRWPNGRPDDWRDVYESVELMRFVGTIKDVRPSSGDHGLIQIECEKFAGYGGAKSGRQVVWIRVSDQTRLAYEEGYVRPEVGQRIDVKCIGAMLTNPTEWIAGRIMLGRKERAQPDR